MKPELGKCKKLLDSGLSLVCVGENKVPNFSWKDRQTKPYTKESFERDYNYESGIKRKDGTDLPATKGIGIVTGYSGLEVIDIDLKILPSLKEQQDFWFEYTSFLRDNIADFDDKFVIYKTVNNGYHILYKCEDIAGNQKIAKLKGHTEAIIETRGIGGYVFIYENKVSKKSYFEIQEISGPEREILLEISRFYNFEDEKISIKVDKKEIEYKEGDLTSWEDYDAKTSILDVIDDDFEVVRKLSDKYIIKRFGATSAHSGYVYMDSMCMYLFSTGTIYPNEKLISPFVAYSYKHHNGNFSAAAKDLYAQGFGTRIVKKVKELEKPPKVIIKDQEFPIDIFPTEIQNYIIRCNQTLDSSIDYMGCSMLWMLSVIIGNSLRIQVKTGWTEAAATWISVVGKAGIGKTPSISNIVSPLVKANNREIRKFIKEKEKFDEYMALEKKERENTEKIKQPVKTQFIVDDITLEALFELHEENKNAVGVFKDELAGWLKDMNKYRDGSDMQTWLSSWSGQSISLNRKTSRSAFVYRPLIPVLGGIQPGILDGFYTDENKDNGFIDRMLLCYPELKVEMYNDNELNSDTIQWYQDYIISFYDQVKNNVVRYNQDEEIEPWIAVLNDDAKREWKRIFNEITAQQNSDEENEYMKSMLPKQKSYIPRFALLINTFDSFHNSYDWSAYLEIREESMLKAEKLSKYFVSMAKKIKVNSTEVKDIKTLIRTIAGGPFEKFKSMYASDPDINKTTAAEILGVSRTMIYEYIKRCKATVK